MNIFLFQRENIQLNNNEIDYIITLAKRMKEVRKRLRFIYDVTSYLQPTALTSLFEYPGLFRNIEPLRRNIYGAIIEIYGMFVLFLFYFHRTTMIGRSNRVNELTSFWCDVLSRENTKESFGVQISKLHYYLRRSNAAIPTDLEKIIDKHRETLHIGAR